MHQSIIGLEAKKQMEKIAEYPDVVVTCCGGGTTSEALPFLSSMKISQMARRPR